jgi:hypothetical protein
MTIVDLRTYTMQPGKLGAFYKAYGETGFPIQKKHLPKCIGYYYVDIGVQHRVVHLWEYEDIAQRAKCRAAMEADPAWNTYRAGSAEFFATQENRIMKQAPFWPIKPTVEGPNNVIDKRTYFLKPGKLGEWAKNYAEDGLAVQIGHLGRCIGYYVTDIGPQHQIVHLWAYSDLEDRVRRRAAMMADPKWQAYLAKGAGLFTHQENEILRPVPFWKP